MLNLPQDIPPSLSNKARMITRALYFFTYFFIGFKTVTPPIKGTNTSGILTDPSAC